MSLLATAALPETTCPSSRPLLAAGAGRIEVLRVAGESAIVSMENRAPMKLLAPRFRGASAWVFTSSFGGGLVAGDQTALEITVGPGARCFAGTQAATKIYRNPEQRCCSHSTVAQLGQESVLVFAPDPIQAFAASQYSQRQEFRLHAGSGLVLLDWFTAGRTARGERWAFDRFASRNHVYVDDRPALLDAVMIEPKKRSRSVAHALGGYDCIAALILVGSVVQRFASDLVQRMNDRPVERGAALIASASPIPHGAILRVAARNTEIAARELYTHLQPMAELLGDDPWRRKS